MGSASSQHYGSKYFESLKCGLSWSHAALQGMAFFLYISLMLMQLSLGKRESMEDDYSLDIDFGGKESLLASVFDGHQGKRAAQYASKYLHSILTGMYLQLGFPALYILCRHFHIDFCY